MESIVRSDPSARDKSSPAWHAAPANEARLVHRETLLGAGPGPDLAALLLPRVRVSQQRIDPDGRQRLPIALFQLQVLPPRRAEPRPFSAVVAQRGGGIPLLRQPVRAGL